MSAVENYRMQLAQREKELADTDRRITIAPTEKAAKFLRAKRARISREIDAINRTIRANQPETGGAA